MRQPAPEAEEKSPVVSSVTTYQRALRTAGGAACDVASTTRHPGLRVVLYDSPPYELDVAPMKSPRLSINLRAAPVSGGLGGERARDYAGKRYSLFFTPAHTEARWSKRKPSRHLNLYFGEQVFEEVVDGSRGRRALEQRLLGVHRPGLKPWIDALELSVGREEPFAEDAAISLASLILASLLRPEGRPEVRLSGQELGRLEEHVQANLEAPIRVADLAEVVGLSPGRFALAFHAAAGCTPYRYVLQQRLDRARHLLKTTRLQIAEVAMACGFSSQQHLTTSMRRSSGLTPSQVRGERPASALAT